MVWWRKRREEEDICDSNFDLSFFVIAKRVGAISTYPSSQMVSRKLTVHCEANCIYIILYIPLRNFLQSLSFSFSYISFFLYTIIFSISFYSLFYAYACMDAYSVVGDPTLCCTVCHIISHHISSWKE